MEGRPIAGGASQVAAQKAIHARQNGRQLLNVYRQNPQPVLGEWIKRLVIVQHLLDNRAFFTGAGQFAQVILVIVVLAQQGLHGQAFFRGRR